jgi:hypothetical protein
VQLPPADVRADAFAYLTRRAMKTGKAEPSKSKRCTVLPSSDNQLYRFLVLQTSLSAEIISHRSFFLADSFQAIIYRCFFTHRQSRRVSRSYGEMMNNVVLLLSIENGQQLAYSCSPALLLPSSTCLSRHRHPSIHGIHPITCDDVIGIKNFAEDLSRPGLPAVLIGLKNRRRGARVLSCPNQTQKQESYCFPEHHRPSSATDFHHHFIHNSQ